MSRLPNFIILGAMKAGSTSLAGWLNEHPQIFLPGREIKFFNGKNYEQGLAWYASHFSGTSKPVLGEKSPAYLYSQECAGRIKESLDQPRLIAVLRHPVDRMWSNYWHAVIGGGEPLSFEAALRAEPERERKRKFYKCYARRSRYAFQLANYLNYFDRSRIHLLAFEDLIRNPQEELRRIYGLLGVEEGFQNQTLQSGQNRTVRVPRSPYLAYCLRKAFRHKNRWREFQEGRWPFLWKTPPKLPPELRARLEPMFKEDVRELDAMMGTQFAARWFGEKTV